MNLKSKKVSLIIGIISLICSRLIFALVNDPEGPNLLIVVGLAIVIYLLLLGVLYLFNRSKLS
jgi:hypothetical protein